MKFIVNKAVPTVVTTHNHDNIHIILGIKINLRLYIPSHTNK